MFAFVMIGQTLNAIAQGFILAVPPKLAQNWFGSNERTFATSM